jgi:hypothetical protein
LSLGEYLGKCRIPVAQAKPLFQSAVHLTNMRADQPGNGGIVGDGQRPDAVADIFHFAEYCVMVAQELVKHRLVALVALGHLRAVIVVMLVAATTQVVRYIMHCEHSGTPRDTKVDSLINISRRSVSRPCCRTLARRLTLWKPRHG